MSSIPQRFFANVGDVHDILKDRGLIESIWGTWSAAPSSDPLCTAVKAYVDHGDRTSWASDPVLREHTPPRIQRMVLVGGAGRPSPFDLLDYAEICEFSDVVVIDPDRLDIEDWMTGNIDFPASVDCLVYFLPEHGLVPNWLASIAALKIAIVSDFDFFPNKLTALEESFDVFLTLGWEELETASDTFKKPVSVFPSIFSLSPNGWMGRRSAPVADLILSGTVDMVGTLGKRQLINQLSKSKKRIFLQNGFMSDHDYGELLKRIGFSFVAIRHSDSCPSRAYQALSSGCVPVVPVGNVIERLIPDYARIGYDIDSNGALDVQALDQSMESFDRQTLLEGGGLAALRSWLNVAQVFSRFRRAIEVVEFAYRIGEQNRLISKEPPSLVTDPFVPVPGLGVVSRGYLPKGGNPEELQRFLSFKGRAHEALVKAAYLTKTDAGSIKNLSRVLARLSNSIGCDMAVTAASAGGRIQLNESAGLEGRYRDACSCFIAAVAAAPDAIEIWYNFAKVVAVFGVYDDVEFLSNAFIAFGFPRDQGFADLRTWTVLPFDFFPELDNPGDDPIYARFGTEPIPCEEFQRRILWLLRWRLGKAQYRRFVRNVPGSWLSHAKDVDQTYELSGMARAKGESRDPRLAEITFDIEYFTKSHTFEALVTNSAFDEFEADEHELRMASPVYGIRQRPDDLEKRTAAYRGPVSVGKPAYSWLMINVGPFGRIKPADPGIEDLWSITDGGVFRHFAHEQAAPVILTKQWLGGVSAKLVNAAVCLAQEEYLAFCPGSALNSVAERVKELKPNPQRLIVVKNARDQLLAVMCPKAVFFHLGGLRETICLSVAEEFECFVRQAEVVGFEVKRLVADDSEASFPRVEPWVAKLREIYSGISWNPHDHLATISHMVQEENSARQAGTRLFSHTQGLREYTRFGRWSAKGCFMDKIDENEDWILNKTTLDLYILVMKRTNTFITGFGNIVDRMKEIAEMPR